jgi:hypothetical protein
MIESMTHETVEQHLPAAALEILEGEELLGVTAHVEHCAGCARLLESYREVVSSLTSTLPARQLDPGRSAMLRARLLLRAGGSTPLAVGPPPARHLSRVMDRWAGWAVAAGLAGLLLIHHSVHQPLAYGWLVAGILTLLILALAVYVRRLRTRLSALENQNNSKIGGQRSSPFP